MSRSRVSRVINEVTSGINDHLFNRWVKLDLSHDAVARTRQRFYEKYGFPGVIGVVDCTHVAIVAPPHNHPVFKEKDYFNHKRYHSLNVQVVCDTDLKITNINSRYCGSTHDAYIISHSALKPALTQAYERYNVWLLGDCGYPVAPWLMTPVPDYFAPNTPEDNFNRSLTRARSTVERCIGVLKSRWRCLLKHRVLHYLPDKVSRIVNSCAVLHNMCVEEGLPLNAEDMVELEELGVDVVPDQNVLGNQRGRDIRNRLIATHFT
ncbi:putative nuclease HARBI1 [Ischnura elegans]|uniref:putative nuclease HARBI1 n=1 Tax=Ischnura elegans TaxID=197161 RepID=UPI001ED86637|nr:putative nuclease HARBI1 [Ischnura elegans]